MKKILISIIRFYQKYISSRTVSVCRYDPTCSAYALQAIERFGPMRGCWLAARRILKCNPLFPGGYDPVPPQDEEFRF